MNSKRKRVNRVIYAQSQARSQKLVDKLFGLSQPLNKESYNLKIRSKISALKTKIVPIKTFAINPAKKDSMIGAGIVHKNQTFITHTTMSHKVSALETFAHWQIWLIFGIWAGILLGILITPMATITTLLAILTVIYFADVLFSLGVILKSLAIEPEILSSDMEIDALKDKDLPIYSILCPLFRESSVLSQFAQAIYALDWPKNKLDVLLLLEESDPETIAAARKLDLPDYFRIVVVPESQPKTKPKACNYGLNLAKGEFVVIYDAEDKPDANQLKKAYLGFQKAGAKVACLQAKLNYYNPNHNLITRLFTAEYSLWFDVVLPGLQSVGTTIPLGGTSNHFRTADLIKFEGWDPFNVTEDCDLGVRLFKAGFKTAIIDSTTFEEANSKPINWLRQRSRWLKGYFQTYLVHSRNPIRFARDHGVHALLFQLVIGGKTAFTLINPLLWLMTIAYFTLYKFVGPTIEQFYPPIIFYMGVTSLVVGNFIYLFDYMIGCAKRGHWSVIKFVFLVPFYWLFVSLASAMALFQLFVKPHYWEKTIHGYHLNPGLNLKTKSTPQLVSARASRFAKLVDLATQKMTPEVLGSGVLIASGVASNFFNFLYNAYLSRTQSLIDFGLISLIGSFLYLTQVPIGSLSASVTHRSAYLFGKYKIPVSEFWAHTRKYALILSSIVAVLWILATPLLQNFFQSDSLLPFFLFAPVWIISSLAAVDQGYLSGNLKFMIMAVIGLAEAISKLVFTVAIVSAGLDRWVYAAIPASMFVSFLIGWVIARRLSRKQIEPIKFKEVLHFPRTFFATSVIIRLASIAYLSLDLIMAKHFLSPQQAGEYSYVSLVGKMVFLIATIFGQFVIPLVSNREGAGEKSHKVFNVLLLATTVAGSAACLVFGALGSFTVPLLWGAKTLSAVPLLPYYCFAMVCFAISSAIVVYHQVRRENIFPIVNLALSLVEIGGIILFHNSAQAIVNVVLISSLVSISSLILLQRFYLIVSDIVSNATDFILLFFPFGQKSKINLNNGKQRILIFNWRDTKHIWAGGAEVYIQELAKRWAKMGHQVTIFCGNDGHSPRHDTIDGVNIIRRGGFYFVYIWAFFYYIFRLYPNTDVIIDSENGLPFFTPIYSSKKVFLLIHHVHQDVFRKSLSYPAFLLANFLEQKFMPLVYRKTEVITVSPSSKADILDHRLTTKEPTVIYNGVDLTVCKPGKKSISPLVLYVGRLKDHKSLPVFIQAAKEVLELIPKVEFVIAGDGPDKKPLHALVKKLNLQDKIKFLGRVSEQEKISLYQKAWVFVNPSLMEGWGITTIEANACGTPAVGSNVGGLRDSIHNPHSGFLVPYGNVEEFTEKIKLLINDKKLRTTMSKEAIEWAKNFDWDKSANQVISIFSQAKP